MRGTKNGRPEIRPTKYIPIVRSHESAERLRSKFREHSDQVTILVRDVLETSRRSDIVMLGCKPQMLEGLLRTPGLDSVLAGKLVINIVAGWTKARIHTTLFGSHPLGPLNSQGAIVRAMPNIAASVAESMTAIEDSEPGLTPTHVGMVRSSA